MGCYYCTVGLVSNLNDSNSQSSVIQFQLTEAEKSRDKLKTYLKQMKNDKNYYREQEKFKRYLSFIVAIYLPYIPPVPLFNKTIITIYTCYLEPQVH